jgi:CubicO group peptidase (beta-lactamase class C family)
MSSRSWQHFFVATTLVAHAEARGQQIETTGMSQNPPAANTKPPTARQEARPWHVQALRGTYQQPPEEALASLERDHFTADYIQRTTRADRLALVNTIRAASASAAFFRASEDESGVHLKLEGPTNIEVFFTIDSRPPFGISDIRVSERPRQPDAAPGKPATWDGLAMRLSEEEAVGFAGVALARHQGREALRRAYGLADQEVKRKTTIDAVYCIGSTPIDFTIAAARMLAQRGTLDLDQPIGRYVPNVPADKASLTSRMILDGRSGLPNFHGTASDWDADLAWIDRDTAVRRILGQPLLFAPGTRQEPSHSAYGLLAALIEYASGKSFPEFLRTEILKPLGMTRTGFYGESVNLHTDAFAIGYGPRSNGLPNIPPNWGPTSWLVMGSGGMFSTLGDMERFYDSMTHGTLLKDTKPSFRSGVSIGGSDRGFYLLRIDNAKGDQIMILTNNDGRSPAMRALSNALVSLVMGTR